MDDLSTLARWDGVVDLRTIGPRHFEAAAFRVCQVLFEGRYAGVMEPMRHYIPLRKDFSNFDQVVARCATPSVRRELTENAHRDLIASGDYDYAQFVARRRRRCWRGPASARCATARRPRRPRRADGGCGMLRSHLRGGLPELLRAAPANRLMHVAEPVTLRARRVLGRPRGSVAPPD